MRKSTRWLAGALLLAMGTVGGLLWVVSSTPFVRDRAVSALNERFASQVELESMNVAVFPALSVGGTGLHLRHNGRTDVEPLISVGAFSASAGSMASTAGRSNCGTSPWTGWRFGCPQGG